MKRSFTICKSISIGVFLLIALLFSSPVSAQTTCNNNSSLIDVYTSYGFDAKGFEVQDNKEDHVLGSPDDQTAKLKTNEDPALRGNIIIELTDWMEQGDTIYFNIASDGHNNEPSFYEVATSSNGIWFESPTSYTATSSTLYTDFFIVESGYGAGWIQFTAVDDGNKTEIESIFYNVKDCMSNCSNRDFDYVTGVAVNYDSGSTSDKPWNALGLPDKEGTQLNGDGNEWLILDLGTVVPYGTMIQLHLADDDDEYLETKLSVLGSLDNASYSKQKNFFITHEKDAYVPYYYEVKHDAGIRYLYFEVRRNNTKAYVDAVQFKFPDIYGESIVSGFVFSDDNSNGSLNLGEAGYQGATVNLYRDLNNDGNLDPADILVSSSITDASGHYEFILTTVHNDYIVEVDAQSLPGGTEFTQGNVTSFNLFNLNKSRCIDFGYTFCTTSCQPDAYSDSISTIVNTPAGVNVIINDRGDIDINSVTVSAANAPLNGSVFISNGVITYTPNPNFTGNDDFVYVVCGLNDPSQCDSAIVYVEVRCPAQTGQNTISGSIFLDFDTDGNFDNSEIWTMPDNMTINLISDLNGDGTIDALDVVTASTTTSATGGYSFAVANNADDYIVQVVVSSGPVGAALTTSSIQAVSFSGSNQSTCGEDFGITFCGPTCPPILEDDNGTVASGSAIFLNVLNNDADYDNNLDPSSLAVVDAPSNGLVVLGENNQLIYSPNGSFTGSDQFTYTVCDQTVPTPLCGTATVYITVTDGYNDPCVEATREHTFYLPFPETELRTALINSAATTCNRQITNVVRSVTTIKSPYPGVVITYDQWEDGYEVDMFDPAQPSTLVWGDADLSNGIAPGYPTDIIPAGGDIILDNNFIYSPRNPLNFYFDGKDKIHTTNDIALSKISGDDVRFEIQAAKTDVYDINRFGTSFIIPFGEDLGTEFQYTALFIRAMVNGSEVVIDLDNNGIGDTSAVLNEGEVLFIDGGVLAGTVVSSTFPVGVDIVFGGLDCFGTRNINILPASFYSAEYYTPVPTTLASAPAAVYLYNSYDQSMTINWSSLFNSGTISVPAKSTTRFVLNDDSGYRFRNLAGTSFTAIEVIDSDSDGDNYDWAFNLISSNRLTALASIAWGPGSLDGSANWNPVWVTPVANTTIYIKYDGNITSESGLISPCGMAYDDIMVLDELEYGQIFDNSDNDQSGVAVFTCDGTPIAAVYGEDPAAGNNTPTSTPAMDVGTTIQPMCLDQLVLANDDYETTPPATPVTIAVMENDYAFLTELDPYSVSMEGLLQPSNGIAVLAGDGTIIYTPRPGWQGIDTFQYNVCSGDMPDLCDIAYVYVTVVMCDADPNENLVNGYVYLEQNPDDGEYVDEEFLPGFTVHLYSDVNCDGHLGGGDLLIESQVTNASGAYSFSTINALYVRDEFEDTPLGEGNDGSEEWFQDWEEIGENNGFATSPVDIVLDPTTSTNSLRINGGSNGIEREVDFDGATEVSISFDYRRLGLNNSGEQLTVNFDGNTIFVIDDGNGVGTDAFFAHFSMDIPYGTYDPEGRNMLEFVTNSSTADDDYFIIDNVQITFNVAEVCFITAVDVSDQNGAYSTATLDEGEVSFLAAVGDCANELYLGVIAELEAIDDYSFGLIDQPQDIDILVNDIGNPDVTSVTIVNDPSNGYLLINLDGTVTYQPNPGFSGTDQFDYQICSNDDPDLCDIARVFITVTCLVDANNNVMSGSVYADYNENAVWDIYEPLYPNMTVNLFEDVNGNGVLDGTEGDNIVESTVSTNGNYSFSITPPISVVRSEVIKVAADNDDATEESDGDMRLGDNSLLLRNSRRYIGMRFQNVNIPPNAIIESAYVEFTASTNESNNINLTISMEEDEDPGVFVNRDDDLSDRWDALNTVAWNNVEAWDKDDSYNSPDITPLVQNLVNLFNWEDGNSMVVLVKWESGDERSAYAHDRGNGNQPELRITYRTIDYPQSYITVVDAGSMPEAAAFTTDNFESATFNFAGDSDCSNDFGISKNNTQAISDVNMTLQYLDVSGRVMTNDFDLQGHDQNFMTFLDQYGNGTALPSGSVVKGTHINGATMNNAGSFTYDAYGSYTFSPNPDFMGFVNLSYFKCDEGSPVVCDTASLTIKVAPFTNPYIEYSNSVTGVKDYTLSYGNPISGNVLFNDSDPEHDGVRLMSFKADEDYAQPQALPNGSFNTVGTNYTFGELNVVPGIDQFGLYDEYAGHLLLFDDGYYQFTPRFGFFGEVSIDYSIEDDFASDFNGKDDSKLKIKVLALDAASSNAPPFAGDDFVNVLFNTKAKANWLANDGDNNGDKIYVNDQNQVEMDDNGRSSVVVAYTTEKGGTLEFYDDGNYEYTPMEEYFGPDRLAYRICDVNPSERCDSATIYFVVTPVFYDYGDLPAQFPKAGNMIPYDLNADGIPDMDGTIYLGSKVDGERESKQSAMGDGDNGDKFNDEDGLIFPNWDRWDYDTKLYVIVNGYDPGMTVYYGIWIDWDFDGRFDEFYNGSGVTHDWAQRNQDTLAVPIHIPGYVTSSAIAGVRIRAFLEMPTEAEYGENLRGGEVEDYVWILSTVLPVEMTYFEAEAIENDAHLTWETASEVNNDYFSVQRSSDAVNWEEIGMVEGHGNSTEVHNYDYIDEDLDAGVYYYRLEQFDYDGASEYSAIRSVTILSKGPSVEDKEMSVFPVPMHVAGTLTIEGLGEIDGEIRFFALDGSKAIYAPLQGNSMNLSQYNLSAGMYIIDVEQEGVVYSKKILLFE